MALWHPLIFLVDLLQASTRKDGEGASIFNPFRGGAECGSARIPYDVEHGQSPEAPERLPLSWASQVVV